MSLQISACTWSLQNDLERITQTLNDSKISGLHLDANACDIFKTAIKRNNWFVSALMISFPQEDYCTLDSIKLTGGIIPDDAWPSNRDLTIEAIRKAAEMKVPYLSMHAGFMDHNDHAAYSKFLSRITELADSAAQHGVTLLLETGQETAEDLKKFLKDIKHPAIGVNFDPANMILYAKGDPIEAIQILAPWIRHVHVKDAIASSIAGQWGQEVPWGDGDVNTAKFFKALNEIGYEGTLAIERESGEKRAVDIALAAKRIGANT